MQSLMRLTVPLTTLLLLSGCAAAPAKRDPHDPWERMNRATYKFNDAIDRGIALPVARGYQRVTPQFVRTGVSNFFDNLNYPTTIVNDVLQAQVKSLFTDTGRLVLNTTLGVGGLFDPASSAGLPKNARDFGQTLGKWGIGAGPYLVLPFLGPSDVRDVIGRVGDHYTVPQTYLLDLWPSVGLGVAEAVDLRYRLLPQQPILESAYDPYGFVRSAYLQRRQFLITGARRRKMMWTRCLMRCRRRRRSPRSLEECRGQARGLTRLSSGSGRNAAAQQLAQIADLGDG
jgi:phospholipid-binding lipoprotein MlaA